ncbi:MAG: DUF3251 domain-containing protein [Acidobacteria bacterium]|nr:DUF3251 domain-containing protein [Acidobacteriota bacterium]MBI3656791.1 DUF3251 domain-containing protein [Acidobacteriota bacterium]
MNLRTIAIIVAAAGMAPGCADPKAVAALEKRATDLEAQVTTLKSSVEALERDKSFDKFLKDIDSIAYLTPGSDGYSTIQTDLGRVTVMLVNVQPYANGTRVTLCFGNLLSAAINGAKATLEWGAVDEKGTPKNDSARSREVKFAESLRAGAWTNVQVVLEGVPPTDLGFVRVKDMTHTGISLIR